MWNPESLTGGSTFGQVFPSFWKKEPLQGDHFGGMSKHIKSEDTRLQLTSSSIYLTKRPLASIRGYVDYRGMNGVKYIHLEHLLALLNSSTCTT
jgi:hypothetical protein